MYKILVVATKDHSSMHGASVSVHTRVLEYDSKQSAEVAYLQLEKHQSNDYSLTAIRLFD